MKKVLFVCMMLWGCLTLQAAQVDTITTYSQAMAKEIKVVVVTPAQYRASQQWPVVYLLHGYSGDYSDWITRTGQTLQTQADQLGIILVCPDGGFKSWYWDSPLDSSSRYETYVAKELVQQIDTRYSTIQKASGRAITGLSMGGHGALYLAFRHPQTFGAAGSMSGGVDITPYPGNWGMSEHLGNYAEQKSRWEAHNVFSNIHFFAVHKTALIIDCGKDDFFFPQNQKLHEALTYQNIAHDYIVRPGAHTWEYWRDALPYQLLFMKQYFQKQG
jgi:S-formylglutathione hydrolase FrmB